MSRLADARNPGAPRHCLALLTLACLLLAALLLGSGSARAQAGPAAPTPTQPNSAAFYSQSVPTTMVAGRAYDVAVTMRNTGCAGGKNCCAYRSTSKEHSTIHE